MKGRLLKYAQLVSIAVTAGLFDAALLHGEIWSLLKYQTATSVVVIESGARSLWGRIRLGQGGAHELPAVPYARADQEGKR